jgi:hypothetical protein
MRGAGRPSDPSSIRGREGRGRGLPLTVVEVVEDGEVEDRVVEDGETAVLDVEGHERPDIAVTPPQSPATLPPALAAPNTTAPETSAITTITSAIKRLRLLTIS